MCQMPIAKISIPASCCEKATSSVQYISKHGMLVTEVAEGNPLRRKSFVLTVVSQLFCASRAGVSSFRFTKGTILGLQCSMNYALCPKLWRKIANFFLNLPAFLLQKIKNMFNNSFLGRFLGS